MSTVPCFVGLDYHQDAVQVCVLDAGGRQLLNRSCPNDWRRIADAVAPVGAVRRAAVEACCGAADLAEELNARAGWHLDLTHPGYVERVKRSPDKSDYSDGLGPAARRGMGQPGADLRTTHMGYRPANATAGTFG